MAALPIDPGMPAGEVLRRYPATLEVFDQHGVVFCAGCFLTLFDPLGDVAGYHAVHDVGALLQDLNRVAAAPAGARPAWAQGSAPGPAPLGKALGVEEERRVQEVMAADSLAATLGIRLLAVRHASARAGVSVRPEAAGCHPALAAALVLYAARAADLGAGRRQDGEVLDLSLAPLDLGAAGSFLVAEAHRAGSGGEQRASAYHVRLLGRSDATVGLATVLLAPGS